MSIQRWALAVLGAYVVLWYRTASEILVQQNCRLHLKQYHKLVMQGPSQNSK